jgi:CRISPR system Cascade subunit CasA
MASFDLREHPWIVVETLDRTITELSTRAALHRAHELRAIVDESPLVLAALTRHLLAILHRAYDGPKTVDDWLAIFRAGRFDAEKIDRYLDSDRARDRMDLFHPERPFAQTKGVAEKYSKYARPIEELELLRSEWGTARSLFRHRADEPAPMSPAAVARALLAHHAFATGGLIKKPGEPTAASAAPLTKAAVVLMQRATLFETLLCNLNLYSPSEGVPSPLSAERDACSWEGDGLPLEIAADEERAVRPTGYLGQLTWLSRRVEVLRSDAGVTAFVNAVGFGLDEDAPRDPMVTYRRDEKRGWVPIGISVDRAFWRSSLALFEAARSETAPFVRPRIFDLLSEQAVYAALPGATYALSIHGIAASKSRIDALRVERLELTARALANVDARTTVESSLQFAEHSVHALLTALWTFARHVIAPDGRSVDNRDLDNLVRSTAARESAWSEIGVHFETLLKNLGDPRAAARAFEQRTLTVIRDIFTRVTLASARSGAGLQARAHAEGALDFALNTLRPNKQPAQTTPTIALAEEEL